MERSTKLYEAEPIMKDCQKFETDSCYYFHMAQEPNGHLKMCNFNKNNHKQTFDTNLM